MRLLFVLALAIPAAGCPDDDDGDDSNYVAVADMPAAYKDAYCTYLARCGMFPDKATCVGAALAIVPTLDPNVVAAVGAGRVIYNGNNVKECFDAVANDTCDQTDENGRAHIPACGAYFQGTVLAGGECYVDQECISQQCSGDTGTSCVRGACIGETPPERQVIGLGMSCVDAADSCVDGTYCDTDTNVCTALKASGEACTGSTECGYGLACAGPSGTRACQPLPGLGEPCRLDLPCRDEGHFCNTATATCAQVGVAGSPCTSSMQCSLYYRCNVSAGTCAKGPSAGESCSSGTRCFDAETYCDSSTLTCTALAIDGMPCTQDLQCASDHCDFNGATPVCASPPLCF